MFDADHDRYEWKNLVVGDGVIMEGEDIHDIADVTRVEVEFYATMAGGSKFTGYTLVISLLSAAIACFIADIGITGMALLAAGVSFLFHREKHARLEIVFATGHSIKRITDAKYYAGKPDQWDHPFGRLKSAIEHAMHQL